MNLPEFCERIVGILGKMYDDMKRIDERVQSLEEKQ